MKGNFEAQYTIVLWEREDKNQLSIVKIKLVTFKVY